MTISQAIPIMVFMGMVFFFVAIMVVGRLIKAFKDAKHNQESVEEARAKMDSESNQSTTTRRTVSTNQTRTSTQQPQRSATTRHEQHVQDAHAHGHTGEEEHYEEIVGSLGDVNDEGCADLNGVRFIAHDLAYDPNNGNAPDYNKLAKAMVLGEILNSPRFKKPYGRK